MAMLHATQFWQGSVTSINPTKTALYTVPAGYRIIVRSMAVRNLTSSGSNNFYFFVNNVIVWSVTLAQAGNGEWRPWLVAGPGDVINAAVSASAGCSGVLSGSLYTI